MLVETSLGLVVARLRLGSFRFCAAMGQAIGGSGLLGLQPIGSLARSSQIDNVAHEVARR
jgi:hypothetical protein